MAKIRISDGLITSSAQIAITSSNVAFSDDVQFTNISIASDTRILTVDSSGTVHYKIGGSDGTSGTSGSSGTSGTSGSSGTSGTSGSSGTSGTSGTS